MTPKTTQLPALEDVILRDKGLSAGDERRIDLIEAYYSIFDFQFAIFDF